MTKRQRLTKLAKGMKLERNRLFAGKIQCLVELQLAQGLPFLRCGKTLCHRGKHEFHKGGTVEMMIRW